MVTGYASGGSPLDPRENIPGAVKSAIKIIVKKLYDGHDKLFEQFSAELLLLNSYRVFFHV